MAYIIFVVRFSNDRFILMKELFRFLGTLFRKGTTTRCALTASNSQQSEQTPMVQAWWHLNAKYKFRLNSLSGKLEMCERRTIEKEGQPEAEDAFREVTRLDRNQLLMELQEAGILLASQTLLDAVISNRMVPLFNPIEAYLGSLSTWDGQPHIEALMARLTNQSDEQEVLHRAFVAMVAQMTGRLATYGNTLCPVLISTTQGWGKSQFVRRLLPDELRMYFSENFNMANEEQCLRKMSSCVLISLDEINRFSESRMAQLKSYIQMPVILVKKRYQTQMEQLERRASFWGTANVRYVLTDETGNRRFYPVMLKDALDLDAVIDYEQLYAQALAELEAGTVRPYFTQEENKEVERRNRAFCAPLRLRQLLDELFEVIPIEGAKPSDGLTATEAFDRLVLADAELMKRYNERNFGEQLKNAGFVQLRSNSRRAYNIRTKLA